MTKIKENNYYSGEGSDGNYQVIRLLPQQIPIPSSIPKLLNGALVSIGIAHRLEHIQTLVDEVLINYKKQNVLSYKYALEAVLISMKRVLDDLVMSSYCMLYFDDISITKRLDVDGFGALFRKGKPSKIGKIILERFIEPLDEFAVVLNEIVNSYKHSYLLPEAQTMWGIEFPTVVSIYAYRNDYSKNVVYHNHSFGQIVIGFNKMVKSIVERQKKFCNKK